MKQMKTQLVKPFLTWVNENTLGSAVATTVLTDPRMEEDQYSITKSWLDEKRIENYTINDDLTVDVDGDVNLTPNNIAEGITAIPIQFRKVSGNFSCGNNKLTTLEGCPSEVGGTFHCPKNKLTSLKGGPTKVGKNFQCHMNQLTSLEFSPSEVGGHFICWENHLTSLKGCPDIVGGDFNCSANQLTSLEGCPSEVGGYFECAENELKSLEFAPKEPEMYHKNPCTYIYDKLGFTEEAHQKCRDVFGI